MTIHEKLTEEVIKKLSKLIPKKILKTKHDVFINTNALWVQQKNIKEIIYELKSLELQEVIDYTIDYFHNATPDANHHNRMLTYDDIQKIRHNIHQLAQKEPLMSRAHEYKDMSAFFKKLCWNNLNDYLFYSCLNKLSLNQNSYNSLFSDTNTNNLLTNENFKNLFQLLLFFPITSEEHLEKITKYIKVKKYIDPNLESIKYNNFLLKAKNIYPENFYNVFHSLQNSEKNKKIITATNYTEYSISESNITNQKGWFFTFMYTLKKSLILGQQAGIPELKKYFDETELDKQQSILYGTESSAHKYRKSIIRFSDLTADEKIIIDEYISNLINYIIDLLEKQNFSAEAVQNLNHNEILKYLISNQEKKDIVNEMQYNNLKNNSNKIKL